ncbi:hypothetical protein Acr_15g0005560 [Actinidia rufa]|uniref:Reverse transcriptase zinc-binding domain-containing protein n=1 Tax=Actinidia rufa TaxID=165716 RepID=A0A7J0FU43_9ERIC|nr:hypothetical protein Acr_15g0005560 [Actinidia rufa]
MQLKKLQKKESSQSLGRSPSCFTSTLWDWIISVKNLIFEQPSYAASSLSAAFWAELLGLWVFLAGLLRTKTNLLRTGAGFVVPQLGCRSLLGFCSKLLDCEPKLILNWRTFVTARLGATVVCKMAKGKNKATKCGQGSVSIRHVEIDGRSIAIMSESQTLTAKAASYTGSSEMCESDRDDFEEEPIPGDVDAATVPVDPVGPPGVRQNALEKTGNTQCETSMDGEQREAAGEKRETRKAQRKVSSFAGLFTGNRLPSEDSKLELFNQDEEMATIELKDIQESDFLWKRCLIGYFAGRFPGKQALRQITNSWNVQVTVKHHGSRWLIFQFSSEDDKVRVLGNGPYIIYGRPLLLKAMPHLFRFGNEAISSFPVWIQLRMMGHTQEGCKAHKNKNEAAKPTEVVPGQGKETEAAATGTNDQPGTSGAGTNKGNHPLLIMENPETEANLTQKSGPEVEAEEIRKQALVPEPVTEENQNLDSRIEPEKEESLNKVSGPSKEQPLSIPKQQKKCMWGQLLSSKLARLQMQRKSAAQPIGRSITAILAAKNSEKSQPPSSSDPAPVKGEEGKKKRDKKAAEKYGLNSPLKQNGIAKHVKKNKVVVMGILETKLNQQSLKDFISRKFRSWTVAENFQHNPNGQILIIWQKDKVELDIIEATDQSIHCLATWDFNTVLSSEERINGIPITSYQTRDFQSCCYDIGISDVRSTGAFHTWSNNSVGANWIEPWLIPDGFKRDHDRGASSFKFFNMWAQHESFLDLVTNVWSMRVEGTAMFRLCKKLKALKDPLKALNKHNFSHISARAEAAEEELNQAQQNAHDNPGDVSLQIKVPELRVKAIKLAEAEMSFCAQLAKAKYLKHSDRGTEFFHDLIKSNRARNQIISLTKADGETTSSTQQEQAVALTCPVLDKEIKDALFDIGDEKAPGPDGKLGRLKLSSEFNFHPKCAELNITYLAFADDLILFARGDVPSVKLSLDCLKQYGDISGLRINASKSNVFMAGINSADMEEIKAITGFSVGKFPFRYLGIPVAAARLTIEQFSPLTARISEYISAWARVSLSYAGRSELIRSVLQGVECFWLSILPIPVGVRDKVIALCRNFLWGGQAVSPKKPLVTWKEVCKPKSEGGLGFIDLNSLPFWEYTPERQDTQMIKQLAQIRDKIVSEEGSCSAALDQMQLWIALGKFNVKASYEFFRPKGMKVHWNKIVWHRSLQPKHSFILWLSLKERLLTREKLVDQIEDTSCILCGDPVESVSHLFFRCTIVRQIWTVIKGWLGFSRALTTLKATAKRIVKEGRGTGVPAVAKKLGFAATVYCIWKARNVRIF